MGLALITDGEASYQRAKTERFDLASYFTCIVIEGEFGVGKPDYAVFKHALGTLGCSPQNAWMVGDSLVYDIRPALKLGLEAVWIDGPRSGLPPDAACQPGRTIGTLAELLVE